METKLIINQYWTKMMKYRIAIVLLLSGCSFSTRDVNPIYKDLPPKNKFISFSIDTYSNSFSLQDTILVGFTFENLSQSDIYIDDPQYIKMTILPMLYYPNGDKMPLAINSRINYIFGITQLIKRREFYKTNFFKSLNEYFKIVRKGNYKLLFKYMGGVYDLEGNMITNDEPIYSNTIEILIE